MKFSANLGFLWTDLSLTNAIRAAKHAGFDAVECHWPYDTPAEEVREVLDETQLSMLGLNTRRGDNNGVAAAPGRVAEAREYIDEAISYARIIDAPNIHVMAGFTDQSERAEKTFRQNLIYACTRTDKTILIEPLNTKDAPGYHLSSIDQALETLKVLEFPNLKIMFDCYHIELMQGDLLNRIKDNLDHIGHIQFAGVPNRAEPDQGDVDYTKLLPAISDLGWTTPFGAEYKPEATTDAGLGWMKAYQ